MSTLLLLLFLGAGAQAASLVYSERPGDISSNIALLALWAYFIAREIIERGVS
jgi:hypothetical protein